MTGRVTEVTSKKMNGVLRHFIVVESEDLRYNLIRSQITIPLDEANGACVGEQVTIEIVRHT